MVKNHSDMERGNPLSPHRLLFPISSKGSSIYIYMHHARDRTKHTTAFVTPVEGNWLERGKEKETHNIIFIIYNLLFSELIQ